MSLDRRTFLTLAGAGGVAAMLPAVRDASHAGVWALPGPDPARAAVPPNRYVEGPYAPVTEEVAST